MKSDQPNDVVAQETVAFAQGFLPEHGSRILDVGCGDGKIAARLKNAGYVVTAIDSSPDAVASAKAIGIEAQQTNLLDFSGGPFDALLFSLSLHHINPLESTLDKACDLLAPGGRLIIEELAFDRVDSVTASLFFGTQDILLKADLASGPEYSGVLEGEDSLERWHGGWAHRHHEHHDPEHHAHEELHSGAAMKEQLISRFELVHEEEVPGLYGFWLEYMNEGQQEIARLLLGLERKLIVEGAIRPLGIRWVAQQR